MFIDNGGTVSVKSVAQNICLTVGAVSQTVKSLTAKKLITREHSAEDLRIVNLKLTEKGRKKLGEFKELHLRYVKDATTKLTDDDLDQFAEVLSKVYSSVTNSNGEKE
jgi:DNA-binding MarR family transcriptional regulator